MGKRFFVFFPTVSDLLKMELFRSAGHSVEPREAKYSFKISVAKFINALQV